MSRATRHGLRLIVGVVAVIGALWLGSAPRLPGAGSADTDATAAITQRAHGGIAAVALRAPAPCARCEHTRRDFTSQEPTVVARPLPADVGGTALYARLGIFRL